MTVPTHTDGNALAGPLATLFAVDLTTARTTCAGCGRVSRVAELHVYVSGPGTVARCPGCEHPILRHAQTPTSILLDLRGAVSLNVPLPNGTL